MSNERYSWSRLADYMVSDRRTILKSFGAASVASLLATRRSGAQSGEGPSQGHMPVTASPEVEPESGEIPVNLAALLSYVPAALLDGIEGASWYYADIAQQFAAMNLHHDANGPDFDGEPWLPATMALATVSGAFSYAMTDDLVNAIGFQPLGVDQTLLAGEPPSQLTIFRGGFERRQLESAWQASGYEQTTTASGATAWSIGDEGDFDITHPIQSKVFAAFNNLVLLDDGVLLCASSLDRVDAAIAAGSGGGGSLMDDDALRALIASLPSTTVSAIASGPVTTADVAISSLEPAQIEAILETFEESDAEVGPMPRYSKMLFGVTAGAVAVDEEMEDAPYGAPDFDAGEGLALVRLATGSSDDAEQAITVVEHRWETMDSLYTGEPFTDLMDLMASRVEGDVAAIDFAQVRSPSVWRNMPLMRDLAPFAISV